MRGGAVRGLSWSTDGTCLSSAVDDGTVNVWDARTWQAKSCIRLPTNAVDAVARSPDRSRLAGLCFDEAAKLDANGNLVGRSANAVYPRGPARTVKVSDAKTEQRPLTLQGHVSSFFCVAWSPDGSRMAGGTMTYDEEKEREHHALKIWDAKTGDEMLTLKGHAGRVYPSYTNEANRLGMESYVLKGFTGYAHGVAWSHDGTRLASASLGYDQQNRRWYGEVKVWDARTGRKTFSVKGYGCVAWSPDGRLLAGASENGAVKLWDGKTGKEPLTFQGDITRVEALAWNLDGTRLAGASESRVKVWAVAAKPAPASAAK
jgi:WD40 repeat protein